MKAYPDDVVISSTTLVDAYQTTKQPSPEHSVMANFLKNYLLENKVKNTKFMQSERTNLKSQTLVNRTVRTAKT